MRSRSDRSVLITGVSRSAGIGVELSLKAARLGYGVFATYYCDYDFDMPGWTKREDDIGDTLARIESEATRFGHMECDLRQTSEITRLFDTAERAVGPIYALVNNAGFSVDADVKTMTAEMIDDHFAVNMRAPMLLCKEFVQRWKRTEFESGKIINLTSGYPVEANPGNLQYSSTKAGMDRFSARLASELADTGITVNSIDPGPTDTGWMSPESREKLLASSPAGRLGTTEDVAKLFEFLLSDGSRWITGQVIHSRGGSQIYLHGKLAAVDMRFTA